MRKLIIVVAVAAFAGILLMPRPSAAFSVRIGPYHFSFPLHWHRHRHHGHGHPEEAAPPASPSESETASRQNTSSRQDLRAALFYPRLALPALYAVLFTPAEVSAWPFDYRTIFAAAFPKPQPQWGAQLCQQQIDVAAGIVASLRNALAPNQTQTEFLQRLGSALGAASGTLATACPSEIPADPLGRLQLTAAQQKELSGALGMVRQPLQDFQQSLSDEQRARFFAMIAAPADKMPGCGGSPDDADRSVGEIAHAVQPTSAQRAALDDLRQALLRAEGNLDLRCRSPLAPTATSRLDALASSLEAAGRAVLSIKAAFADFTATLSDEQKNRFNALTVAAP
jgi:hypothetical protein